MQPTPCLPYQTSSPRFLLRFAFERNYLLSSSRIVEEDFNLLCKKKHRKTLQTYLYHQWCPNCYNLMKAFLSGLREVDCVCVLRCIQSKKRRKKKSHFPACHNDWLMGEGKSNYAAERTVGFWSRKLSRHSTALQEPTNKLSFALQGLAILSTGPVITENRHSNTTRSVARLARLYCCPALHYYHSFFFWKPYIRSEL